MTTPDIAPVPTASPDGAGPGERAHREPVEARLIATGTVLDSLVQRAASASMSCAPASDT